MNDFKKSLKVLLFIYDGENHIRSIDALNGYLLNNNLNLIQFNDLFKPLISSGVITFDKDIIKIIIFSADDFKEILLVLFLYHIDINRT